MYKKEKVNHGNIDEKTSKAIISFINKAFTSVKEGESKKYTLEDLKKMLK